MSLHKTQIAFKDMMINRQLSVEGVRFNSGGVSLEKRMGAYKNNFSASLSDVLAGTFQTVTALVGEEFMRGVCSRYARLHPPTKACMHDYGEQFPEFLESFEPAQSLPYLPDMARLDWAANTAYHADDLTVLSPDNIENVNFEEEDFKLSLHPSTSLIHSEFPVHELRQYVRDIQRQEKETFDVVPKGTLLLVSRQSGQVYILELSPAEYHFIQSTRPLTDTLEETLRIFPEFDFQIFLQKTLSCETFLTPPTNRV